ncbi:uncharacterized protein [Chiloscyllium punctatum]|uniref:uncharacterized protein n=1 Tax=Chiloscyllium punctatum TaxID=137246 RepID=UPI003B63994F
MCGLSTQESPDSIAFPAAGWIVHHLIECSWSARERQRERRSGAFNKSCSEVFLMSLTQQNSQFLSCPSPTLNTVGQPERDGEGDLEPSVNPAAEHPTTDRITEGKTLMKHLKMFLPKKLPCDCPQRYPGTERIYVHQPHCVMNDPTSGKFTTDFHQIQFCSVSLTPCSVNYCHDIRVNHSDGTINLARTITTTIMEKQAEN